MIFCFFIAATVCAQDNSAFQIDVKKYSLIDSLVKQTFLLVVDGVPTEEKPTMLNIFSLNIIDNDKLPIYWESYHKGVIVINTKTAVVAGYKKKLSTLSRKYRDYLLSHQNDDNDILYVISNGKNSVNGSSAELLRELYEIQFKKVKKVQFVEGENTIMSFSHFAIIITKQ